MITRSLTTFTAVVLMAGFAFADLGDDWKEYFDGPAGFLITKKEKKEWKKKVKTAEQAERFVELFWAKRDPDLQTPLNEFLQDFELRVEAADEAFGTEKQRGALTDRGQFLVLLGRPAQRIQRQPDANTGAPQGGADPFGSGGVEQGGTLRAGANDGTAPTSDPSGTIAPMGGPPTSTTMEVQREIGAIEAWFYDPRTLPVPVRQEAMLVVFRERKYGEKDYEFVRDLPRNTIAMKMLAAAPDLLLKHPDLTSVPRYGLIQGTQPATVEQLGWFDAGEQSLPEEAGVIGVEGLVSGPRHFIWTHLFLPPGAPTEAVAVGRLRDAATGDEVGSFQMPASALELADGVGYELSVPVGKGTWQLDLAFVTDDGPIGQTTIDLETTSVPMDATIFSKVFWGAEVSQYQEPDLGDPFGIGGWHIVPRYSGVYTTAESLTYMGYVLQPKVRRNQEPQFTLTVALYRGERRLVKGEPQPAQLSQVMPDMWMFASGIELERIGDPGDYRLEIVLKQDVDGASTTVEIPFKLVAAESEG
jgi:GWxTD domain-containing protein